MGIIITIVEGLDEEKDGLKNFLAFCGGFDIPDTLKTAEEARSDIPRLKPDIVIVDINWSGMNGIAYITETINKADSKNRFCCPLIS